MNPRLRNMLIVIVLVFAGRLIYAVYTRWHHKQTANLEKNHDVMKYFVDDNEEYIRLAFNKLESQFKDPNDFTLDAFSVRKRDTTIQGISDTVYTVYFTYYPADNQLDKFFSKVSVWKGSATVDLYNLDTRTNGEYKTVQAEKNNNEAATMRSLRESLQELPESTRKKIRDTIAGLIR